MALLPFLAWDDFDTYTIGTNVAGHTLRGGGAPTYKPQYSTTAILPYKRRYLEFLTDATTDYHAISRDACDGLRDFDRVFGFAMSLCTVEELHLYARGAGTATMTDFVRASIVLATGAIRIDKMVASAYTAGSAGSAGTVTLTAGHAYLGRFNGNGATVSLKIWDASLGMAGEPTAFDLSPGGMPTSSGWHAFGGKHTTLTGKVAAFNFDAFSNTATAAVCPRTNTERTAWLAKQDQLRIVVAKMRATGYDSSGSPYTKVVKAYIANHGYTSAAQDTPSLQHFDACITGVPAISREMPAALSGQAQVSIGRMRVANNRPARIEPARTVTNLLSSLHDLTASPWATDASGTGTVPTLTAFYGTAPDGSQTAMRLQLDRGAGVGFSRWRQLYTFATAAVRNIADSVYVKTADGSTKSITLREGSGGATAALISVNGTWKRIALNSTTTAVNVASLEILSWSTTGGDQTADLLVWHPQLENLTGNPSQIPQEYARKDLRYLVVEGDSLTTGQGSSGGNTYPKQLQDLYPTTQLVYFNVATSGQTLSDMTTDAAAQVDPKRDPSQPLCAVVIWGGTNDIYFGASGATAYSRLVTYCQARQAAGFKVVALTMLPRSNVGVPVGFETDRTTFNTSVRADWRTFADALADVAADARIGDAGDELDTTYYDADKVHMNNTGYGVVAGIVRDALYTLIAATPSYVDVATQVFNYRNGNTLASNIVTEARGADFDSGNGTRDDWLRTHWLRDGFELILLGQGWPLHDGMHLIRGRLGNPVATDLKTLEFPIADMSEALNVPLTTQKFSSGDLNGLYKPVLIGLFDTAATGQFEPPETSSQVFQISDTALQSTANAVGNVLDNQVQLTGTTGLTHTSADTGTEIITVSASHGAGVDSRVVYTAGTPPAPLVVGTTYWIKTAPGAATFTLAATRGGATINLTTAGTAGSPLTIYNYWFDEAAATMTLIFARTPGGRITVCDVSDDGSTSQIHTAYTNILTRAGLNANYVGPGFTAAAFDAGNPALWFDSNPHTCAEAMARLAKGSLSWYGFAADGPLGGGSVTVPAATAVISLDRSDIADVRHESTRRATDFSVAQRSCGAWYLTGGPLNVGTIWARQQKIVIAQVAATTGVPIDDHAQVTDADKASEFSYDALTNVPGATSYDLYRYNLGIFSIATAKLTPLECTVGDTVSIDFPRLGFKNWTGADDASPDNTAEIDSRLAVVVGHYLKPNKAGNSYSHVDLKVFRRIPGYYPTANLN